MAIDKAIDSAVLDSNLTAVANAIRAKGGTSDPLAFPDGFVSAVEAIQAGGGGDDNYKALIEKTLVDVVIPNGVTKITPYTFYSKDTSSVIKSITFPDGIEEIGDYAFYYCRDAVITSLPKTLKKIGSSAFYYCEKTGELKSLPSGLTYIGSYAFRDARLGLLTELPDGLTTIETYTFYGTGIALTTFPPNVTKVGTHAFTYAKNTFTELPEGLLTIGSNAFEQNKSLTEITLPSTLTSMDWAAFSGCSALTKVTFKGTPKSIYKSFTGNSQALTINVPWSEGEVADAPWGATNATINYNYTSGEG